LSGAFTVTQAESAKPPKVGTSHRIMLHGLAPINLIVKLAHLIAQLHLRGTERPVQPALPLSAGRA